MRFRSFSENWTRYCASDLLESVTTNSLTWDDLNYDSGIVKNIHYGLIHKGFTETCISDKNPLIPWINGEKTLKNYTLVGLGDLILADASEDRKDVGKPIEIIDTHCVTVSGLHTIHAKDKTDYFIPGYKGFYFQSSSMKNQIYKIANGSKIYGISPNAFNELYISIPNKNEQAKIVDLLIKIEERISTQNKIIEYELLKNTINSHLIGNETPNIKISECMDCLSSSKKESDIINAPEGDYPAFGANGLIRKINTYDYQRPGISIVKDGAGVGRMSYLTGKYSIVGTQNLLINKSNYNLVYLYYALQNLDFRKYVVGSGIPHIYFKDYKNEYIYLPDNKKMINIISKCLSSIDVKISIENEVLDKLLKQKEYLLSNMFI